MIFDLRARMRLVLLSFVLYQTALPAGRALADDGPRRTGRTVVVKRAQPRSRGLEHALRRLQTHTLSHDHGELPPRFRVLATGYLRRPNDVPLWAVFAVPRDDRADRDVRSRL